MTGILAAPTEAVEAVQAGGPASPLTGQVALITGGAGGLGAAIAEVLAQAGMAVVIGDVAPGRDAVAERIAATGGSSLALELDVRDPDGAARAVQACLQTYGGLDVLVNDAAIDKTAPFEELSLDDWDRILDVNLRGPVLMTQAVWPTFQAAGRGHVVNIASTAAKRAWTEASAYHATKWGLLGFSHALHAEGRRIGIKVTAVIAGGMRTPFLLDRFPDIDPAVLQDPRTVARTIRSVLEQPAETVIPEVTVLPMRETSWP